MSRCGRLDGTPYGSRKQWPPKRNAERVKGLRQVQLWLPDTSSPAFKAQVAHDIAALKDLAPEDEAMFDAFERIATEDLREWP